MVNSDVTRANAQLPLIEAQVVPVSVPVRVPQNVPQLLPVAVRAQDAVVRERAGSAVLVSAATEAATPGGGLRWNGGRPASAVSATCAGRLPTSAANPVWEEAGSALPARKSRQTATHPLACLPSGGIQPISVSYFPVSILKGWKTLRSTSF